MLNEIVPEYGGFQGPTYILSGSTEAGKTTFVSKLVTQKARRLIRLMIGEGSSTITDKTFVLSEDSVFKDVIRLVAKPKKQALSRFHFDKKVTEVISLLAKQASKQNVKKKVTAKYLLGERFLKGENHIALLSLIDKEGEEWLDSIANTIESINKETLIQIYDIAKSQLDSTKKSNSKKNESIDNKLNEVVTTFLDGRLILVNTNDIGKDLTTHFIQVNDFLLKRALDYFGTTEVTKDGYLVLDLDITDENNKVTKEKLGNFFSNNANDMNLSIEVLYSEIVVYVGINQGLLKQLGASTESLKNRNGMVEIGLLDTMGAYHKQFSDEAETKEYFNNLLKGRSVEGMIMLIPLSTGANDKKFLALAKDFLSNFPFDLNVVLINNKVDSVIQQFVSQWKSEDDDAFSENPSDDSKPSEEEMQGYLKSKLRVFEELIQTVKDNGNGRAKIIGHYVTSFTENDIKVTYVGKIRNFSDVAVNMFKSFSALLKHIEKISVKLDADFGTDISLKINQNVLEEELLDVLEDKMFTSVNENAKKHIGIVPNGNGFNALVRQLKRGEGHNSDIDLNWYVNVTSFNITFPGTIKNSINDNLNEIWLGIYRSLDFEGIVEIDSKLKEKLFIKLLDKIDVRQIVIQAVYEKTYTPILTLPLFSFEAKFQNYMEVAKQKLGNPKDVEVYAYGVEHELQRAFKEMLDKDVIYKYE